MNIGWMDQLKQGGIAGWAADLRIAAEFLTRLPLPAQGYAGALAGAVRAFPLVGAAIGASAGVVYGAAVWLGLTPWLAAALAVAAALALTGALHEDGLGDLADGFGGGATREAKLAIMRDSRIGTYGVAALTLTLLVRVAALLAAGAVSRAAMAALMGKLDPARHDGLGFDAGRPDAGAVMIACGLAVVIAMAALGLSTGLAAAAAAAAGAAGIAMLARRQIGGQTGDVLGAAQQMAEITFLMACVALAEIPEITPDG
jgi:adenosylcobinamide-GDP ribazoletransferase